MFSEKKDWFDWIWMGMFWLFIAFAAAMIGLLVYVVADKVCSTEQDVSGVCVSKHYQPSQVHTGTGVGSKGEVVTTVLSTPEQWIVIVTANEVTRSTTTTFKHWSKIKEGDTVDVRFEIGGLSGKVISANSWSQK